MGVYCSTQINYAGLEGPTPFDVEIYDARQSEDFSLSNNGFELQILESAVEDWTDLAEVERCHYDEVTVWAKAQTGCEAVLFFPAILRNPKAQAESDDYAPILFAHSDYTENYKDMIGQLDHPYHRILKPSIERAGIAPESIADISRVLTLQLWRNVGPKETSHPLCVCDPNTVPREQLAPVRVESYGGAETQFDAFALVAGEYVEMNRWYTYPAMAHNEVMVFRAYDSDLVKAGKPFWTPHCSFENPNVVGVPRSSVEMRAICLFW